MKTIFAILILTSTLASAQVKVEMPLSGSSPEINKMLRDAWTMMSDARMLDARELLKQVREKDPDFALAYLFTTSETETEKENVVKALTLRATPDEKLFILGRQAAIEKKLTPGHFDPLIKKYPNDKQLHLHFAWLTSDSKRSVEILSNLIKRNPDFAPAYNIRGYGYLRLNEMEKAAADFDKYISLKPDLANPYDSKADYLMRAGKIEEAIALYEKAATMDQQNMTSSRTKAENAKNKLYGFKIPERTASQKHNRTIFQANAGVIAGIAYTKHTGGKAIDYGSYCGNLYKTSWNKAAGFEGFVRGALFNYESFRRENDPPIEILKQDNNSIEFKWKLNYRGMFTGDSYGVTFEEFTDFMNIAYSSIADYVAATYTQEVLTDDWLKVTITRKQ
jgi:tetratricopeptide (TPR) repeat protein